MPMKTFGLNDFSCCDLRVKSCQRVAFVYLCRVRSDQFMMVFFTTIMPFLASEELCSASEPGHVDCQSVLARSMAPNPKVTTDV